MANGTAAKKQVNRSAETTRVYPCNTPDCDGKIGPNSVTGLCHKCYASLYTWLKKKSAGERLQRARKLKLWESRLNFLLPEKEVEKLNERRSYNALPVLPGKVKAYRRRSKYKVMK